MTITTPAARPSLADDPPPALLEFIAENLSMARISAEIAMKCIDIRDDFGRRYHFGRFLDYARAAQTAEKRLRQPERQEAARVEDR